MGDVGEARSGCDPNTAKVNVTGIQKEWELGDWGKLPRKSATMSWKTPSRRTPLNTGTDRAYLQDTPYWDQVLMPLLEKAMKEMFWRIVWFGDKDAKNIADGGILKAGINPKLFNMCDGLWKRLQAIIAANPNQHTEIAANAATTYLDQKNGILVPELLSRFSTPCLLMLTLASSTNLVRLSSALTPCSRHSVPTSWNATAKPLCHSRTLPPASLFRNMTVVPLSPSISGTA